MDSQNVNLARIESIYNHNADTRSLLLKTLRGSTVPFRPGQFLSFLLPIGQTTVTRAYTVASLPDEGTLFEICLNRVGDGLGSSYLFHRSESDILQFNGPWGNFVLDQSEDCEQVFIADRTGVVPFRPMIHQALSVAHSCPIRLIYGERDWTALLYYDEWRSWEERHSRFSFEPVLIHNYSDARALMPFIEKHYSVNDGTRRRFYICGIGKPLLALRDVLRKAEYERTVIKYERW